MRMARITDFPSPNVNFHSDFTRDAREVRVKVFMLRVNCLLHWLTDILDNGLVVVFVGINPSPMMAATGHTFAGPSNRFWRVTHLAGWRRRFP